MKFGQRAQNATEALSFRSGPSGQVVSLSPRVLDVFRRHQQHHFWQPEAGGQLFAEIREPPLLVVSATEPKVRDFRARFSFVPHRPTEQREIDEQFSVGLHYVGDWHTHPQDTPLPSDRDVNSINEMVRLSTHNLSGFLLVIVGRRPFPGGLFVGFSNGRDLVQLSSQGR